MKKLLLIAFLCSFSILFSQAKNVYYTDFIDFTDNSGIKYNVMMITDQHDENGRADSTVRILYTSDNEEHLVEFHADCYLEKLKNGNTKISFIPTKNTSVQIIKGKDVAYNPDTFVYEIDTKTSKITGTQSDKNTTAPIPIVYKNSTMSTLERKDEIERFYFRAEPMHNLLKNFYNKKIADANKITPYFDALGWFGSDGIAYQAFIVSLFKNNEHINTIVRIRYEKEGEINIVEYDAQSDIVIQSDDNLNVSVKPKTTTVSNIKGTSGYNPDTFSYTLDINDKFIKGKQSDENSSADLSYISINNRQEFALKFYSEKDEIFQKYVK